MNFLKRTIPLMITAGVGFVLIVASFIPATVGWGEVVAVWFDILAAVAFILGGGNLLKVQLKKISDRAAGWGYALVTLVAFLATLIAGLFKLGAPPADNQEFYGQVFAKLPLEELPESQTFRVPGEIPHREVDDELPASVRRQLSEENGEIVFKGWIRPNQVADLKGYNTTLKWHCTIEQLQQLAQPPDLVKGNVSYFVDHESLAFSGPMTGPQKSVLMQMQGEAAWEAAVDELSKSSQRVVVIELPEDLNPPKTVKETPGFIYDKDKGRIEHTGPMSTGDRDKLLAQFPIVTPLTGEERTALRQEIESKGEPLTEAQAQEFEKVLDGLWTSEQLIEAINAGGIDKPAEKTACELLEEQTNPKPDPEPKPPIELTPDQTDSLKEPLTPKPAVLLAEDIVRRLNVAGQATNTGVTEGQTSAVESFLETQPTIGERNRTLYFALLKAGPLTADQKAFLLADIQAEAAWQAQIVDLFLAAHQVKYPWSGDYTDQGTMFWWVYEYLFKPLTATMFALLAFYVASAAFRAFRAKNVEASLLLGTAFIILLGRTFAGVLLTGWMPEALSGLKIENLAVYIMQVFNTAGNRAIMIGIALGIASTSLKVLLGIDRSYLGSSEE